MQRLLKPKEEENPSSLPILLSGPPIVVDGYPAKLHRLRPFNNSLGRGSFGNVFSVRDPSDGGQYALKCIRIPNGIRATVVQEVNILMKLLNHENIVQIVGAWPETIHDSDHYNTFVGLDDLQGGLSSTYDESVTSSSSDWTEENLHVQNKENEETSVPIPPDLYLPHSNRDVMFIKMELCDHSLEKYLAVEDAKSASAKMTESKQIFAQLLSALHYLNQVGIVHNDIRPANILFKSGVIKLADFGLSCLHKSISKTAPQIGKTIPQDFKDIFRCSPYKSPELCLYGQNSAEVRNSSDVFSVGGVMVRLLSKVENKGDVWKLLDGEDQVQQVFAKLQNQYPSESEVLDIVQRMVSPIPKNRPSTADLQDLWIHSVPICQTCAKFPQSQINFVSREEWGAELATELPTPLSLPMENVIIIHSSRGEGYCSTDEQCAGLMREIQALHMNHNKWDDIGYQFAIGGNGRVYEGRGWDKVGAHTLYYNRNSIGICLMGDFRLHLPPVIQLEATQQLIQFGVQAGYISPSYKLYGHRDVRQGFDSPWEYLYQEICKWPHKAPAKSFD